MENLFNNIPFFSHFSQSNIEFIINSSEIIQLDQSQIINVQDNYCYMIKSGLLGALDQFDKINCEYLIKGSLIGHLPSIEKKTKTKYFAITYCEIIKININDIFKIFINDVKQYKAYLNYFLNSNLINKNLNSVRNNIITVVSNGGKSGKSILTSLIAYNLSEKNNTIIIDLSYKGTSVFEYLNKPITPPIAEKNESQNKINIRERIIEADFNLDLLNLVNTSKVKLDPSIISPILFDLSNDYENIIIDCDSSDTELLSEVVNLSDSILMIKKGKIENEYNKILDENINRNQRLLFINNLFLNNNENDNNDLKLEKLIIDESNSNLSIKNQFKFSSINLIINEIFKERNVLVLKNSDFNSFYYVGLFNYIEKNQVAVDQIIAESFSFINSAFYVMSENMDQYYKYLKDFFRDERMNVLMSVSYPEKFIFSSDKIEKYFSSIFKKDRIENQEIKICCKLFNGSGEQNFSTGQISKICSSSFGKKIYVEGTKIFDKYYYLTNDNIKLSSITNYDNSSNILNCGIDINNNENTKVLDEIVFNKKNIENDVKNSCADIIISDKNIKFEEMINVSEKKWNDVLKKI